MSAIRLDQLTVHYGPRRILDGVSLDFAPGLVHGLIGPNGAGKSTMVQAMLGLLPYGGTVAVGGDDLARLDTRARARRVAYLAQDSLAPSEFTGRQLVEMGRYSLLKRFQSMRTHDVEAVERALATTGAHQWADRPTASTSGGERQLTGLSRALAQEAPVLVLDEPISALDLSHELTVLKLLGPWVGGAADERAVVVVLHDLSLAARFCDRLVLLAPADKGATVIAQGAPEEVLTPELLRRAYGVDVDVRVSDVTGTLTVTPI